MAVRKHIKTKYEGVFYRETTPRPGVAPDRTYTVCYRDAKGKLCWHTVGRHSAGIRAAYASQVRRKLLDQVAGGKNPARAQQITVGDAVDGYLSWAEKAGKRTTPDRNRWDVHLAQALQDCPITSITTALLQDLKNTVSQKLGPQSIRHCFSLLRRSVNLTIETQQLEIANPFRVRRGGPFQLPRADNDAVRFLTPGEAARLLEALQSRSRPVHDMALLSLKTGLRATEIFSIQRQGVDMVSVQIHFIAKGGERQHVHAPADILAMLAGYDRPPDGYIFESQSGERQANGVSRTFERVVEMLQLNAGVTDRRHKVTFHTLRHTFASWLAQSGQVTLQELMLLMRHKRIEMTLRYAHLLPDGQREKLGIIDQVLSRHYASPVVTTR